MGLKQSDGHGWKDIEIMPTLRAERVFSVSGQTTSTSMPAKSTDTDSEQENSTKGTSEQLTLPQFQTTTLSLGDFLANLSVLLASGEDSKILEAHYSLKYAESLGLNGLNIYSLRTSKDSSTIIRERHLKPLSERWMNWGMTVNGKCLTAKTTECHKTGNGCSLSQILEENVDSKYFLSEKQITNMKNWNSQENPLSAVYEQEGKKICTLV